MNYLFLITSFLSSFISLKLSIPLLTRYLLDEVNERSSHTKSKPRGGGIIILLITLIGSILLKDYKILFGIPLFITSLIDDLKGISMKNRFIIQLSTVISLLIYAQNSNSWISGLSFELSVLLYIPLTIFLVGIINFINFMDGVDGMIASNFIIIFAFISLFSDSHLIIIIGSLIAFIFFNWHPSKVFLGDIGSIFIGYTLISEIIFCNDSRIAICFVLVSSPLLLDPLFCLIARLRSKKNIFKAHKTHLYQGLHQAGLGHPLVSTIYFTTTSILCISYLIGKLNYLFAALIFFTIIGFYINKKMAVSI